MKIADTVQNQHVSRGQKIWAWLRDVRDNAPVSFERAKLVTASYKETEGLPMPIRRAKAFEKIITEIPIYIDDDQLLVGDFAASPMGVEMHPDLELEPIEEAIEGGIEGSETIYNIRKEDIPLLREIYDYWKIWNIKESFLRFIGKEEVKKISERGREGSWLAGDFPISACIGWAIPNYAKAIGKGLLGILDEVEEELRVTSQLDNASRDKVIFLKALRIILNAGIQYGKRYSALAAELAKSAEGKRKEELERIAEVCDRVPGLPARSFYEALQTMLFCQLFIYWDHRPNAISPGRVDQYLYPYYRKDINEGKLSDEKCIELLECFRCKITSKRQFLELSRRQGQAGETEFINCTLGGITADGEDATNELSYLWLEAAMRTNTPHPTLSIRVHDKMSLDFALKAAEVCSLGLGYPAWFGDKTSIAYLLDKGCTLEEARDYAIAGCVLHSPQNKSAFTWPLGMSVPKVFELALNGGIDPRLGKQLGPKTGKFEDMSNYDELYKALKEQLRYFIAEGARCINEQRLYRAAMLPSLVASCFFDDCIKRGQDVMGGGCTFQHVMYLLPRGVMDVVDSLAAIKKLVFEDGSISKRELMDTLAVNFDGKESVRKLLLSAPKFGNGDDYVDCIAVDLYGLLSELMDNTDACYGVKWVNAPHNLSGHGAEGRRVGALPSGRLAGTALADGAVSPCQGADVKGCTAVIESCGKIDQLHLYGAVLNMKFHPSALKTEDDLRKFISLIQTYLVDYGGKHIQFNVVSRETLLDAQAHPENYRSLVVRVAGYSALWVELDRIIQDEIISRTEHSSA